MTTSYDKNTLISPGDPGCESLEPHFRTAATDDEVAVPTPLRRGGALEVGDLVDGRFRVRELVQSGGMGDVYLADDLVLKLPIALKTLRPGTSSPDRFEREAERLKALQHPGIPKYITHQTGSAGAAYLAMEWLVGVDFATHLRRVRLGPKQAVAMVRAASDAVAAAHTVGIIHRDINPSNLFLSGPDPEDLRVLDFGVARFEADERPLTADGAQIGTPGYMAPEQVEGRRDVGPAADVFSLGCVLYEAVTGQRAFHAPTIRELLARMVNEQPPSPQELQAEIANELNDLIMRMLAKEPSRRPRDALEVVTLLDQLPQLPDSPPALSIPSIPVALEQHVTSLIVLRGVQDGLFERAGRAAEPHGMTARRAADGLIVIPTRGAGTAGDHATRAARCALAVQRATRAPQMTVSTGLSQQSGSALSGRAFDSALVSLLLKDGADQEGASGPCLWLDENTASLLDSRFDVRTVDEGFLLRGLRETYEPTRTVLGRKVRCVGRKRELTLLDATVRESMEDMVQTSILVTGLPGIGKSRLAAELTRTARRDIPGLLIIRGGADSMNAGSPWGSLIQAIERLCRMRETEPDSQRRSKLHERLKSILPEEELGRVSEFLSELLGITGDRARSAQLEAARRDPVLRGDQIQRALSDWLRAECKAHAVLLILDDFHWGDLSTVKFIDNVLRNYEECPLVVLALARPEVHDIFPKLWAKRGVTELRLSGLSRRAAADMIDEVLGSEVEPAVVARIIDRAQGNPFWIEELLRAEDAGQGENVPDRVVLLAQSRIEQQDNDERRLLKGASVFGRQFSLEGVVSVLGPQSTNRLVEVVLRGLVEDEFVLEFDPGRAGGQLGYEFSSGLLRDAAYSMLGEDEKEQAHLRAATWLERCGDSDPLGVALHFSLGGEPEKARPHYLLAAEQALAGDDLPAAISCAEEGIAAGARGRDAVRLRLIHAEASKWQGDNLVAFRSAQAAFSRAEEGTPEWFRSAAEAAVAAGKTGKRETALGLAKELLESDANSTAGADRGSALSRLATQLTLMGELDEARALLGAVLQGSARLEPDPHVMGFYKEARAVLAGASDDPLGRVTYAEQAVEHFEDAGDMRNACLARLSQGFAEIEFGAPEQALITLEHARLTADRLGLSNSVPVARAQLGRALSRLGNHAEAEVHLEEAATAFDRQKNVRLSGMSRLYLAEHRLRCQNAEGAMEAARRAAGILEPIPPMLRLAHAVLAALQTTVPSEDTKRDAATWAELALGELSDNERLPVGETLLRVAAASGLYFSGQTERAIGMFARERERVSVLAGQMSAERAVQFLSGEPARAFITGGSWKPPVPLEQFDYATWLMDSAQPAASQEPLPTAENQVLAEVRRITAEEEPVLRNLWITQSYHRLSGELAGVIDKNNVNWSTFACWASKTAGVSIRNEEISAHLRSHLGLDANELRGVGAYSRRLLETFGLGRQLRRVAIETLSHVSSEISLGNRKVYAELAPLFAQFVEVMQTEPSAEAVNRFVDTLEPGSIEEGGQELLKRAFVAWFEASRTESESLRAQLILRGNCQIGLHEQTRLQPHIQGAMDAPIATLFHGKLVAALPAYVGAPLARLVGFFSKPFVLEVTKLWERIATRHAMNLALPGGNEISLGEDLPNVPQLYPPDLRTISDAKTEALIERFDSKLNSSKGSGANNWADLHDRMGFIIELFRSRQQEPTMFGAPFDPSQEASLAQGKVPEGRL